MSTTKQPAFRRPADYHDPANYPHLSPVSAIKRAEFWARYDGDTKTADHLEAQAELARLAGPVHA